MTGAYVNGFITTSPLPHAGKYFIMRLQWSYRNEQPNRPKAVIVLSTVRGRYERGNSYHKRY